MKKVCAAIFIASIIVCVSFSDEQEFIKQPKEKKICPSKQQLVEQQALLVDVVNDVSTLFTLIVQDTLAIQKQLLKNINGYVDGDKDCFLSNATKKQRITLSDNIVALKAELEKVQQDIGNLRQKIAIKSTFLWQDRD